MKTALRMTLAPLVIGSLVVACSGGSTPVDPEASSAAPRASIGVGSNSGGATPVDPSVSSARDAHGGLLPPGTTNGAGEGSVHPFDVGSCSGCGGCHYATCPNGVGAANTTYRPTLFTCAACANSSDSAHDAGTGGISNPIIELVFWGSKWSSASPTPGQVAAAMGTLVQNSDYFVGLQQYGVSQVTLQWVIQNTSLMTDPQYYEPPSSYLFSDVQKFVHQEISNSYLPPDNNGSDTIYLVMMPPGTAPQTTCGVNGQSDHNVAYAAFADLDGMMLTATHELVEAMTDAHNTGWIMDRTFGTGTGVENEIGDACNVVGDFINGVMVQSYWSNKDKSCIIPYPPTCGNEFQACCGDLGACTTSMCASASDVCSNGLCQPPCGGYGQACCLPLNTPGTCTASGTVCDSSLGKCAPPPPGAPSCPQSDDYWTCGGTYNNVTSAVFNCTGGTSSTLSLQRSTGTGWQQESPSFYTNPSTGVVTINEMGDPGGVPETYRVGVTDAFGRTTYTPNITFTSTGTCTCTPGTCASTQTQCGTASDGCGGTLHCGGCTAPLTCSAGQCVIGAGGGHCKPGTCM
jgi:hypothetical protein